MAITTHHEFWAALFDIAEHTVVDRHPEVAFTTGFCLALRIAALRPDFALSYERLEEAGGIYATGVDDVQEVVGACHELLEIAPEAV